MAFAAAGHRRAAERARRRKTHALNTAIASFRALGDLHGVHTQRETDGNTFLCFGGVAAQKELSARSRRRKHNLRSSGMRVDGRLFTRRAATLLALSATSFPKPTKRSPYQPPIASTRRQDEAGLESNTRSRRPTINVLGANHHLALLSILAFRVRQPAGSTLSCTAKLHQRRPKTSARFAPARRALATLAPRFTRYSRAWQVQGGDVSGKGEGKSIYGEPFAHDNYSIMHNTAGLISMVNSGVGGYSGTSDSRFLIQPIDDAGFLDGRYEAFGRVTNGLSLVRQIDAAKVGGNKKAPVEKIVITGAGQYPPPPPPAPPPEPCE